MNDEPPTPRQLTMTDFERKSRSSAVSVTVAGVAVNGLLIVMKFLAGIFGHSQALVADAVHSVSDLVTDAVTLIGLRVGQKPPDKDHHFGHGRIETMASAVIGLALLITAAYLGTGAVFNIYRHAANHPTLLAVAVAVMSILFKELLYRYAVHVGRRLNNQLLIANAWHHRSDALSSVAVLIGVAGARINPAWHILDAVAALVVSFFIIRVGMDILKGALREISDAAPDSRVVNKIKACSLAVDGVIDTHDLRIRTLAGQYQMEIHIVVEGNLSVTQGHELAKSVEACICDEIARVANVIVHVDPKRE